MAARRATTELAHRLSPLANAAVVIRARASRRDEDEAALHIDRQRRPRVAGAGARRGVAGPGNGIPGPAQGARAGVEGAHDAALHVDRTVVADGGADDDEIAGDGGRRGHLVLPEIAQVDAAREIDLPVDAEVPARRPGRPVQGDETRIEGAHEDAQAAPRTRRGHRVAPGRDAARRDLGVVARAIELDVVLPELRAGPGIERDDLVERRAEEQLALDEDRRGLERGFLVERRLRLERARAMRPGHPELRDVRPIDLRERRIAAAAGIIAVTRPRGIGGGLCTGERWEPEERDGDEEQEAGTAAFTGQTVSHPAAGPGQRPVGGASPSLKILAPTASSTRALRSRKKLTPYALSATGPASNTPRTL